MPVPQANLSLCYHQNQYPHFKALAQRVMSGEHTGLQDFSFGLELLLAGLETLRLTGQPQP